MIYFFGDLRQLRKFELARPTISRPMMPLPISPPLPFRSTHSRGQSQTLYIPSRSAPLPEKSIGSVSPSSSPLDSPISFVTPSRPYAQFSNASLPRTSCESCESEVCPSAGYNEIDVSPAFFDDVPAPEGPATASCLHRPEYRLSPSSLTYLEPVHTRPEPRSGKLSIRTPATGYVGTVDPSHGTRSPRSSMKTPSEYGPTAGFIPHGYNNNSTTSLSDTARSLRSRRSACYFDFDALPPPNRLVGQQHDGMSGGDSASLPAGVSAAGGVVAEPSGQHASVPASLSSPTLAGVGHFVGRTQYKCNQRTSPASSSSAPDKGTANEAPSKWLSFATLIPSFTAGVPAFATPLTQVQSPVVKRAQWEVVIRAALVAALFAGALTGIVVGVVR